MQQSHRELKSSCKSGWLSKQNVNTTQWNKHCPTEPHYLFEIKESKSNDIAGIIESEYQKFWKITDIFRIHSMGITGGRDKSVLRPQNNPEDMWSLVQEFVNLSTEEARINYELGKDARDWKVNFAQNDIRESGLDIEKITPILFRPFDVRFTYYTGNSRGFHCMPRKEVMRNFINKENIAICFTRNSRENIVSNFFVSKYITDKTVISSSDNANIAPLYIYPDVDTPTEIREGTRNNFSSDFITKMSEAIGETPSPSKIFFYIYSILYSPTYRNRYSNLINTDFARIPLATNKSIFDELSLLGEELVNLHLLNSIDLYTSISHFIDSNGNRTIQAGYPKYSEGEVIINKKGDGFVGVPDEVWNFYIGGYQVCHKWLKDRKGRTLSDDDILHYQRIIVALKETITLMKKIDEAIPSWPIE